MRILLVSPVPPPAGGIATWTKLFVKAMKEREKIKVDIVNTAVIGKRIKSFTKISLISEIYRTIKIFIELNKKLRVNNNIIHFNTACSKRGIIRDYLLMKRIRSKTNKLILHCHCDTKYMVDGKISSFFFKRVCLLSDKIFSLNKSSYDHIMEISNRKSVIMPNFFDGELLKEITRKKEEKKIKNILYVGHITEAKGCKEILSIAPRFPNITFTMIGYLSEEIKKIPASKNIVFLGEISKERVLKEMQASDLFFFPTHTEGFPNVVLEAMACGLPIVSTQVGAIPEMIEDKGGIIVEVENINQLTKAIKNLEITEVRKKMSEWNREKVLNSYTLNIITDEILKEYLKVQE